MADERDRIPEIIGIQTRQLENWKPKLNPEVYRDLCAWATATNETVDNWDSIRRGTQLDNFIANWKPIPKDKDGEIVEFENVSLEVGDKVKTSKGKFVVDGFYYHLRALFVTTECGNTIKGYSILGIIKKTDG